MITRAYQNANGERQEITLSAEEWNALTEEGLAAMLGAKKAPAAKASAAKAADPAPAEAPAE